MDGGEIHFGSKREERRDRTATDSVPGATECEDDGDGRGVHPRDQRRPARDRPALLRRQATAPRRGALRGRLDHRAEPAPEGAGGHERTGQERQHHPRRHQDGRDRSDDPLRGEQAGHHQARHERGRQDRRDPRAGRRRGRRGRCQGVQPGPGLTPRRIRGNADPVSFVPLLVHWVGAGLFLFPLRGNNPPKLRAKRVAKEGKMGVYRCPSTIDTGHYL